MNPIAKVLAALSGGVDSSAAAALLIEAGHEVVGCIGIMRDPAPTADIAAAERVAQTLGIPFRVIDLREAFTRRVVAPFCESYAHGLTPSPCVDCNRSIKFGALLDEAERLGCTHIATGHYARIIEREGRFELHKALDERKDQSYMLARLTPAQLACTMLPLGAFSKEDARAIARRYGLQNAERAESQDICFVPDGDYAAFAARFLGTCFEPGDFIDMRGTVLGRHEGIARYTVGQRKGIGLAFGEPRYVCAIDAKANTVTIGTRDDLLAREVRVRDFSWTDGAAPALAFDCCAKIRYRQTEQAAHVEVCAGSAQGDSLVLSFAEPQRAVAPGQYAVLYEGTRVLGGGAIEHAE